jgi:hypothetical protein
MAQVLGQGLDHDGRQGEVRRPAALLGGPIEKAPLTSRSCSATVEGGIARAMFRVAVSGRREQEASFLTVVVWRDQAEHAAESLSKGSRPARAQLQDHQLTDWSGGMAIEHTTQYSSGAMSWWQRVVCGRLGWHWYPRISGIGGPLTDVGCVFCGRPRGRGRRPPGPPRHLRRS